MLTVATMLWTSNERSWESSKCFDETWVDKLYRQFKRHLTVPWRFVLFTERLRELKERQIAQELIEAKVPHYGCYIEPFKLNVPMILVGLDTLIVDNIDHMAGYCTGKPGRLIALPRDPYVPQRSINGVACIPAGWRKIYDGWDREMDSMEWLRMWPCKFMDDLWPGQVISLKYHKVRKLGPQGGKIIYMHGTPKQHQIASHPLIEQHWR